MKLVYNKSTKTFSEKERYCLYYTDGEPEYSKGSFADVKARYEQRGIKTDYLNYYGYADSEDEARQWVRRIQDRRDSGGYD